MTIFGIIWLVFAFVAILDGRVASIVLFWMVSMILQCDNVIYLGESGVGPQLLASILLVAKSLYYASPRRSMSFDMRCVACVVLLASVVASSGLNGVLSQNVLKVIQLAFYMLAFVRLMALGRMLEWRITMRMFKGVVSFVAIWGIVQLLISVGVIPRWGIFTTLIYNDSSTDIYYNINYSVRLYSTFMEPSYCVCFLIGSFYFIMIAERRKTYFDYVLMIVLLLEILATRSTTGYVAFAILAVIHVFVFRDKSALLFLIPEIVIIGVVVALTPDLLQSVVFGKLTSGSATTRTRWNNAALSNFFSSPVFGVGYKQSRASSLAISLLAEQGVIGIACYAFFLVSFILPIRNESANDKRSAVSLVLAVAVCQIIACPDLDFCVFWLVAGIYALCAGDLHTLGRSSLLPKSPKHARVLRGPGEQ